MVCIGGVVVLTVRAAWTRDVGVSIPLRAKAFVLMVWWGIGGNVTPIACRLAKRPGLGGVQDYQRAKLTAAAGMCLRGPLCTETPISPPPNRPKSRIGPFLAAPVFASICRQPPGV